MNTMNDLETQLRSWAPRRPSEKLEARLFAEPASEPRAREDAPSQFRLSYLAPAAVATVLMCVLFTQRNSPALSAVEHSSPFVAMIVSNQSAAAYMPGSFQPEQNSVPAETFEWTNGSATPPAVRYISSHRREH